MVAGVDVPVPGGNDQVVPDVRPGQQLADAGRHRCPAADRQAAAFAEVALNVDHDQRRRPATRKKVPPRSGLRLLQEVVRRAGCGGRRA